MAPVSPSPSSAEVSLLPLSTQQRFKIFSDPVHGFISVPKNVILDLIQTPEVQRLRRIRQLGVGHLVFPGAEHTRFNHALGAMALMQDALSRGDKPSPAALGKLVALYEHKVNLIAAADAARARAPARRSA